jgi:Uma2 family endonuclease
MTTSLVSVTPRFWTGAEYDRLVAEGLFRPEERVELLGGEILTMAAQGTKHTAATSLTGDALREAFGAGHQVRIQMPLALDPDSRPEPDVAVVRGSARDYTDAHPETALLVVEVADSTLAFDRVWKGSCYARAKIADYWIVNLVERRLEVYREPVRAPRAKYGWKYRKVTRLGPKNVVTPLARPGVTIEVAALLP